MELGFSTMNNPGDIDPGVLAVALEDRGFDSLWFGEHSHIPVGTPSPYGRSTPLPDSYKRMRDPLISLTVGAALTNRLKLGTSVALVVERDPFFLAKESATLDVISEGRLMLGVGAGWNKKEYRNHTSVPWSQRYRLLRDRVGAIRALWTMEESSYESEHISFGPVWSFPKPVQKPHPPVLVGSVGPVGIAHTVEWADGWAPLVSSFEQFLAARSLLIAEANRVSRDLESIFVMVSLNGSPELADLERFKEAGITLLRLSGDPTMNETESEVLKRLDHYAAMIERLR
jgi:probable F420-dependent oxidoreductase